MTADLNFEQSEIAKKLAAYKLPRYHELTSFPIVMRQLTKLLDDYLEIFLVPGEDKMLTQSMINSYVYKKIIPAPTNKEYEDTAVTPFILMDTDKIQYVPYPMYYYLQREKSIVATNTYITAFYKICEN